MTSGDGCDVLQSADRAIASAARCASLTGWTRSNFGNVRSPFAIMPRAVKNAKNDNVRRTTNEKDAIGKSIHQHSSHLWFATKTREAKRILGEAGNCRFNLGEQSLAQTRLLAFVPDGSVRDIHFGFAANDD